MENKYYEVLNLLPSCICAVVFILLLLLDACKALKRKALWIPAESLVLGALTIQILGLIDSSHVSYLADKDEKEDQVRELLYKHQFLIDCSRLTVCVYVSYLIPQMVRSRWTTVWSDIGALVLPVMFYMVAESYFVWKLKKAPSQSAWFMLSSVTLFIASCLLLLLLTCAVMAGKSIRKVISQKLPRALSCCQSANTKDHVLKCWIVTRASQPDYVMARSVFSALAGVVVSVSVVILVIKWNCIHLESDFLMKIRVVVQFTFVLGGWMVIVFRWFTSVMYFPKKMKVLFYMEDFWTRSIAELKDDLDAQSTSQLYMEERNRGRKLEEKFIITLVATIRLHSFILPMRIWLQKLMVYLSKACWFLSEFVLKMIRPFIMGPEKIALLSGSNRGTKDSPDFSKYKEALDIIRMRGEVAYSLWLANEWAFNQTRNHMEQGFEKGKDSTAKLIKLIGHKTRPVEVVAAKSWKMRSISLIYCMIHSSQISGIKDVINDAIEGCCQAWDFLDFIDRSDQDEEAKLVSSAADKTFYTLEKIRNEVTKKQEPEKLQELLKKYIEERLLREETAGKRKSMENEHDSRDWMREALKINLHKTCSKATEVNPVEQCLLANVIFHCIYNKLEGTLKENCSKWAIEGKEAEIYHAAFITGKLNGVREKIGEGSNPDPVSLAKAAIQIQ